MASVSGIAENSDCEDDSRIALIQQIAAENCVKRSMPPTSENIQVVRIQQLLAEAADVRSHPLKPLPSDPEVLSSILLKNLQCDAQGLEELVVSARTRRAKLREELEMQKDMKKKQIAVEEQLKKEESEINQIKPTGSMSQTERLENEMRTKLSASEKLLKMRMAQMSDFLKEHYPQPTNEQIKPNKTNKKVRGGRDKIDSSNVLSMQSMLEKLMNKCMDSPDDPYIELDNTNWPPYIETLLRCGIIQGHPNLSNSVRLTPYHL